MQEILSTVVNTLTLEHKHSVEMQLILTVTPRTHIPLPFDTHRCTGSLSLVAGLQSAEEGDSIARLSFEFPVAH